MKTNELTRRNFLKGVGLVGIVGIGISGCGDDDKYHFNGTIDGEQITFYNIGYHEVLKVKRKDGITITYRNDGFGTIEPDKVNILGKTKNLTYENNELGKPILKEAQKQFDEYLKKILKEKEKIRKETLSTKQKEGLDLIKK